MDRHQRKIHQKKGFSLAELGIVLVIMLIIATIATLSYFIFIDDSKLTKMKEDSSSLIETVSMYYAEHGFLPVGEEVALSEETKEIVSDSLNGFCTTNIEGSIVVKEGKEIRADGLVHTGIYSGKVDGNYVDLNIKAYTVGNDLVSNYYQGETLDNFSDYLIITCKDLTASNNGNNNLGNETPGDGSGDGSGEGSGDGSGNQNPGDGTGNESGNNGEDEGGFIKHVTPIAECPVGYVCIETVEQLQLVGESYDSMAKNYLLMNDLDLSGVHWEPIGDNNKGPFTGTFNGNGYVINNLTVTPTTHSGFFGFVMGGTIENIGLKNVSNTNNSGSQNPVGGLVSQIMNNGSVTNSFVEGTVISTSTNSNSHVGGLVGLALSNASISDSYFKGKVEAGYIAGGLLGQSSSSTISNSYSNSDVISSHKDIGGLVGYSDYSTIDNSYAKGSVKGKDNVGGLIGYSDGLNISNSYAAVKVDKNENNEYINSIDSFIGYNYNTNVLNSYWDSEVSFPYVSETGEGKTTAELKTQSTFNGWDFETVWSINEGNGYPTLRK